LSPIDPQVILTKAQRETIKNNMKAKGYTFAGYARAQGFNVHTFRMWLRGVWGDLGHGKVSTAYRNTVVRDGFLQEK
jgi:hypothetical protein